ncbi:MAG: type IV secretory system conjugative DNA transfer family protein, partial [Flavobacteriales bacterium]
NIEIAVYGGGDLNFIRPLADVPEKELRFYKLALKLCALGILEDEIPQMLLRAIVWNSGDTHYSAESAAHLDGNMSFEACKQAFPKYIMTPNAIISRIMREISNVKSLLGDDHEIVSIMETEMGVGQRWLTPADSQKSKLISMEKETETSVFLGSLPNGQPIYETSNQSLITIAPPGSGKTQCHVLPNIPSYGGSVIVLDVKGECYTETAESRAELGSVFRFGPTYKDSHSFNPLGHLDVDSDDFFDDCKALSALMIVPEGKDPTWELRARDLLSVFLAHTVIMNDAPTLEPVLDLASGVGLEPTLKALSEKDAEHAAIIPRSLRREAAGLLDTLKRSEKQFEGYIGSLKQHLSVWDTSAIERITEKSDWTPKIFRQEKATLYLCVAAEDIERFAPVMRVIIGQHVRELLKTADDECWPPVLFMLDELPRLGQMAPVRTALETGRGKGIKLWMICQYQAQLMEAYGKDIAKGMMGSCSVELYMNASAEDAEFISKRLGNQVDVQTAKDRPLATPQDLVGPKFENSVVAFVKGTEPVLLEKKFFYES